MTLPEGNNTTPPQVPETKPDQVLTPPTPGESKFITREVLDQRLKSLSDDMKEVVSKGYRASQSHTDKAVGNAKDEFSKSLQDTVAQLRAKGAQISDQQVRDMQIDQLLSGNASPGGGLPPGQGTPPPEGLPPQEGTPQFGQWVTQQGAEWLEKNGIKFEAGDPELEGIQKARGGNYIEYLDAVKQAGEAKKKRLAEAAGNRLQGNIPPGSQTHPLQGAQNDMDGLWRKVEEKHFK